MSVIIDEVQGTVDPEPVSQTQEREDEARAITKEINLEQMRAELARLVQREMRLKAD